MDLLTSRSARVKDARALTAGKHRRERGEFLAEGPQAVREAIAAGAVIDLFVEQGTSDRFYSEVDAASSRGLPVHLVDRGALASLVTAQTPQGLIARCRWDPPRLADVLGKPGPGQMALAHEMSDPGNAGALIRVADAAGAVGMGLSSRSVDPTNPKVVRATAGSIFHLPVVDAGETLEVLNGLRGAGYLTLAADVAPDAVDLFAAEREGLLGGRVAWVFGNEAHGLPPEVLSAVDHVVRIPILGRAESLNLATAAAVCLYAVARQSA